MARYRANFAATGVWLRSDGDLRGAVNAAADRVADRARVLAPVRTGRYKASIRVDNGRGWDGRVAADVTATVPYSAALEFGTARSRPRRVLRRAAESS